MNQKEINKAIQEGIALKKQALKLIEDANLKSEEQIQNFKKTNEEYKGIVQNLKDINSEIQEARQNQQNLVDSYVQQEQKLKGLTGLQASLVDKDRARIQLQAQAKNLDQSKAETFNSIASLQNDLLNTSSEDVIQQAEINRKLDEHYASLEGSRGIHAQIRKNLMDQRTTATEISSLSESQQAFLNKQLSTYNTIKDTIGQTLETASLLTSTVGGMLGSALIGAGYAADAIGQSVREFGGYLGAAQLQTIGLGFAFKDAASVTRELSNEFGGIEETSFRTKLNTNLMATNMGITGAQAAKITGTLARNGDLTAQQAQDLAQSTKEFAIQNGVIPADVMGDVAENAEMFASYGKDATQELLKSAVQARKLGVSMSTLGKVTDGLLDFESSITKELELSAMLGRNINLNRARGLAFEGKTGAAVKETIKQLGGQAAFEKMNVIQRRQAADALGLSVDELSKMAKNMNKLNDDGTMQLSTFETWSQSLTAFASGPLGKTLKGVGGIAIGLGQATPLLKDMGINMGGMLKSSGQVLRNILGMAGSGISKVFGGASGALGTMASSAGDMVKKIPGVEKAGGLLSKFKEGAMKGVGGGKEGLVDKIKSSTDSMTESSPKVGGAGKSGKGISSITKSISKIKMSDVVKGAAALVLIAGAMFILGKALQEFQGIGLETLGIAGLALLGLTLSLAAVGGIMTFAGPMILAGAGAMILIAGAMYILGKALTEIAKVEGVDLPSIGKSILGFGLSVSTLGLLVPGLIGAGIALGMLGAGMTIFGIGVSKIPTEVNFTQLGTDIASFASSVSTIGIYSGLLALGGVALGILGAGMSVFGIGASQVPTDTNFTELGTDIVNFATSLSTLGSSIFSLTLAGIALGIAGAGLGLFGAGLSLVPVDVLDGLTNMVTNLVPLTDGIVSLAGAFTLLAGSLGLLSIAGIAALPALIGLSAVGIGLGAISGLFGGGESSSTESSTSSESESITEYHQMVIDGLAAVKNAIDTKDMNVYIDGTKITDFVRKKSESATDNSNATLANA